MREDNKGGQGHNNQKEVTDNTRDDEDKENDKG